MSEWRVLLGDVRETLATLPAGSAQTCVTSPPYWGLRDYGHDGQLGLEPTPDAYVANMVAVFREVRRVLKDDATCWINLGDSYASQGGAHGGRDDNQTGVGAKVLHAVGAGDKAARTAPSGLKPKDLVGIPWALATALRNPYYAGTIRNEIDRVWLAAMLDAEGCLFIHKRKAGQSNGQGYQRKNDNYGPGVEICNTSLAVVERIMALVGKGNVCTSDKGQHGRKQTLYRWNLRTTESRDFVQEVYPYLVAKQQQARIMCGCPSSGERAEAAHAALIGLHNGIETDVDFAAPASLFEPGWYLRSDIIWSKSNPMPESVTDRPTKAHEYIFLLSKSARYFYDAAAIRDEATTTDHHRRYHSKDAATGYANKHGDAVKLVGGGGQTGIVAGNVPDGRNKRTVWTVATQPYAGAHFATFPEALIEPCILAGSRVGDTVLDPFTGSGTTGAVAVRHQRNFVGCELNPAYLALARERIGSVAPMFASEVA